MIDARRFKRARSSRRSDPPAAIDVNDAPAYGRIDPGEILVNPCRDSRGGALPRQRCAPGGRRNSSSFSFNCRSAGLEILASRGFVLAEPKRQFPRSVSAFHR